MAPTAVGLTEGGSATKRECGRRSGSIHRVPGHILERRPNSFVATRELKQVKNGLSERPYRNVVAACLSCNNRKGEVPAEEFLRTLYRESVLSAQDFEARIAALQALREGRLQPGR